jgi:hypothetical protein
MLRKFYSILIKNSNPQAIGSQIESKDSKPLQYDSKEDAKSVVAYVESRSPKANSS